MAHQQQRESDRAKRVIAAREQVERVTAAYAAGRASCEQLNKANAEMAAARYALNNPDDPVCTGRER